MHGLIGSDHGSPTQAGLSVVKGGHVAIGIDGAGVDMSVVVTVDMDVVIRHAQVLMGRLSLGKVVVHKRGNGGRQKARQQHRDRNSG